MIATPIYRFEPLTGDDVVVGGKTLQDYVTDYIALGKELRVPVVDMFNTLGANKYNRDYYWGENGGDGLHPNNKLKEVMGSKMAGALLVNY